MVSIYCFNRLSLCEKFPFGVQHFSLSSFLVGARQIRYSAEGMHFKNFRWRKPRILFKRDSGHTPFVSEVAKGHEVVVAIFDQSGSTPRCGRTGGLTLPRRTVSFPSGLHLKG